MNTCRIGARANDNEIVVHHVAAINAEATSDKFIFSWPVMDQQRIGIATLTNCKSLSGANRNDVYAQASCGSKDRQDVVEQTGVLR